MRRLSPIVVLLSFLPAVSMAQEGSSGSTSENLDPIAYLVGGTWTAKGEIEGFGAYTAERTYGWILDGRFIRQRQVMTIGDDELETLGVLGWDPASETIATWGFGDDGGIATTHARTATADEIELEGRRVGAFNSGPIRATFRKVSEDEFLEIAEMKRGDQWVAMFTLRFTRGK